MIGSFLSDLQLERIVVNTHTRKGAVYEHINNLKTIFCFYLFMAVLGLCHCTRVFSSCREWVQSLAFSNCDLGAQYLQLTGLVTLGHVGSSWTRD